MDEMEELRAELGQAIQIKLNGGDNPEPKFKFGHDLRNQNPKWKIGHTICKYVET